LVAVDVERCHALCLHFLHLARHHLDLLLDIQHPVLRGDVEEFVEKLLGVGDGRSS
jgi:hypothetical protein